MTAHVGSTVGEWVQSWPTLPAFAAAIAISLGFAIAAHRMKRSPHTADPNPGPYTSDSFDMEDTK